MTKIYASLLLVLLSVCTAGAQLKMIFSDVTVQSPGDTVDVEVSVRDFSGIVSLQTSINWDADKFSFGAVTDLTDVLPDFSLDGSIGTPPSAAAINDGQLTIVWTEGGTNPVNVPDGTVLFTLKLVAIGDQCDKSTIDVSMVPRPVEVLNAAFSNIGISGTPGTLLIDNGSVSCQDTGGDGVVLSIGGVSAPKGSQVCLPVTATNFDDIESIQFGLTWDPSVLSLATEDDPGMDGVKDGVLTKVTANAREADQGRLRVLWSFDTQAISADEDDVLLEVCFDVVGETGASSEVRFSAFPDAVPPWSIEISTDAVPSLDFTLMPGTVSVGEDPGGGERNGVGFVFDDLYTDNASSICVPLKVENFDSLVALMVGIGFDRDVLSYTGSQNEIPGLQAVYNEQSDELRILWSETNANPFSVDDGSTIVELCFDVVGAEGTSSTIGAINIPPNFQIEVLKFPGNDTDFFVDDGSVTVGEEPEPIDTLTITASDVIFGTGDTVCVDFTVSNFADIEGMGFVVTWDETVLEYVEARNTNLAQLSPGGTNFRFVDPNKVRVVHTPTSPQSVDNGTSIFQLCYAAIPGCDSDASTDLEIGGDSNVALEFINSESRVVPVITNDGSATAAPCETMPISITATQTRNPGCPGASNGAIVIEVDNAIGSFTCSWTKNGETIVTDNCLLNGVTAGEYTVTVTDDLDSTATATFTLTDPTPITLANADVTVCPGEGARDGSVTFTFAGGDGTYTITESGAGSIDGLTISGLGQEEFTFIVSDGRGCDMMLTYSGLRTCGSQGPITACDESRTAISPNGDAINDEFIIGCLNDPANRSLTNKLTVYNRWGELVYTKDMYENDWTGISSDGDELDEGGYMWVFEIGGPTDRQVYRGTVTILR